MMVIYCVMSVEMAVVICVYVINDFVHGCDRPIEDITKP